MKVIVNLKWDYDVSGVSFYCTGDSALKTWSHDDYYLSGFDLVKLLENQRKLIEVLHESNEAILHAISLNHKGEV